MTWTVADFAHANHNPVAIVNGKGGTDPIEMDVPVGRSLLLDAGQSSDPDGQPIHYHWFHYGGGLGCQTETWQRRRLRERTHLA